MKWWPLVKIVSNDIGEGWNLLLGLKLGWGIQIWPLFLPLTSSSLIIHEMMTPCQNVVKQHQRGLKRSTRTKMEMGNSNMTTAFTRDIIFVNYSYRTKMIMENSYIAIPNKPSYLWNYTYIHIHIHKSKWEANENQSRYLCAPSFDWYSNQQGNHTVAECLICSWSK